MPWGININIKTVNNLLAVLDPNNTTDGVIASAIADYVEQNSKTFISDDLGPQTADRTHDVGGFDQTFNNVGTWTIGGDLSVGGLTSIKGTGKILASIESGLNDSHDFFGTDFSVNSPIVRLRNSGGTIACQVTNAGNMRLINTSTGALFQLSPRVNPSGTDFTQFTLPHDAVFTSGLSLNHNDHLGSTLGVKGNGTDPIFTAFDSSTNRLLEVTEGQTIYDQSAGIPPVGEASHVFKGNGQNSTDKLLTLENGLGVNVLDVRGNGNSFFNTNVFSNAGYFQAQFQQGFKLSAGALSIYQNGLGDVAIEAHGGVTARGVLFKKSSVLNPTSGEVRNIRTNDDFAPTSGNAVFNSFTIADIVNQTGGANGVTRGLFVNPTLTSAADFRAIETVSGKIRFQGLNSYADNATANAALGGAGFLYIRTGHGLDITV